MPKLETLKFLMVTEPPAPRLSWNTLSDALAALPPSTTTVALVPRKVAASSPTSCQTTLVRLQLPAQWTPSAAGEPRMTFFRVAPAARSKIGSWPSSWPPLPRGPEPM